MPLLSFIGAAINHLRAVQARTALQVALDSIIPFSKDVNVGTTNVSASINWTEWEAEPPNSRAQQIQRSQTSVAFKNILTQISKLRVAKSFSSASTNEKPGQIWPGF
ncbi:MULTISPECIES: hypothetical protein [Bradyrhizobium]|uniref:hypothetical protein n=1 Tax=Bradyrhizobium TaxID=374 RepID=UPI000421A6B4|nr:MULTISPECIES: hypothetical protein [Bradyrhizobium]WLB86251.1 hypothetical protein QIH91_25405 [Bradyrhizobium japonicum USDA 135]GLR97595.1 hypothetical protein GCM10007858_52370 [Bradyrhizobium liaoningense]